MRKPLHESLERLVWWTARRLEPAVKPVLTADDVAQDIFQILVEIERRHSEKEQEEIERVAKQAIRWHRNRLLLKKRARLEDALETIDDFASRTELSSADIDKLQSFSSTLSPVQQKYLSMLVTPSGFVSKEFEVFYFFGRTKSWASKMESRLKTQLKDFLESGTLSSR